MPRGAGLKRVRSFANEKHKQVDKFPSRINIFKRGSPERKQQARHLKLGRYYARKKM